MKILYVKILHDKRANTFASHCSAKRAMEGNWRVYLEACIILTASHQTMTYSSISYSSWISIPSLNLWQTPWVRPAVLLPLYHFASLYTYTDPSSSSKPHSNALATLLLLATADSPATKSRRAPRTRLVTVNERTLTVHRIGIRQRGEGTRASLLRRLLGLEILANLSYPGVDARFLSRHTAYDVRPKH